MSYAVGSVLKGLAPLVLLPGCLVSFNDYPLAADGGATGTGIAGQGMAGGSGGTAAGAGVDGGSSGSASVASPNVIDDFQDDDHAILEHSGRRGYWYVANDGMGTQTPSSNQAPLPVPLEPPRGDSTLGIHTFGGPFPTWGALLGTTLEASGASGSPYDISGYTGLRVWLRSGSAEADQQVRLNFTTTDTELENDHFGADIALSSQWQRAEIAFADLERAGQGSPDLAHVLSIQFFFPRDTRFDLWIDDLELY